MPYLNKFREFAESGNFSESGYLEDSIPIVLDCLIALYVFYFQCLAGEIVVLMCMDCG